MAYISWGAHCSLSPRFVLGTVCKYSDVGLTKEADIGREKSRKCWTDKSRSVYLVSDSFYFEHLFFKMHVFLA